MQKGYARGNNGKELYWILIKLVPERVKNMKKTEYLLFSVTDRNLLHLVKTIGSNFIRGFVTRENITDGVHSMK